MVRVHRCQASLHLLFFVKNILVWSMSGFVAGTYRFTCRWYRFLQCRYSVIRANYGFYGGCTGSYGVKYSLISQSGLVLCTGSETTVFYIRSENYCALCRMWIKPLDSIQKSGKNHCTLYTLKTTVFFFSKRDRLAFRYQFVTDRGGNGVLIYRATTFKKINNQIAIFCVIYLY